jgi:hypothetical protein
MPELQPKRTGVQFDGVAASVFLNEDFLSLIREKVPDAHCEILAFSLARKKESENGSEKAREKDDDEKYYHVVVGHQRHEAADKRILTIDADSPEALEQMLDVIQSYLKRRQ